MASEFITVARLRAEIASVLTRLSEHGPLYLTQRGQPRAVLVDVDEYRALLEQLEFLDDSLEVALARDRRDRGEKTRPLADVIKEGRPRTVSRRAPKPRARRAHARVSR
jgi:prevent-host-death family protein